MRAGKLGLSLLRVEPQVEPQGDRVALLTGLARRGWSPGAVWAFGTSPLLVQAQAFGREEVEG